MKLHWTLTPHFMHKTSLGRIWRATTAWFLMFLVFIVTLRAHSLHLDALCAVSLPPSLCTLYKDSVIKYEPKYYTDRLVNDHLHAVIIKVSRSKTALCMSAGCQHTNEYAALLIGGECLAPSPQSTGPESPRGRARCKIFISSTFLFPEINVFYQRSSLFST